MAEDVLNYIVLETTSHGTIEVGTDFPATSAELDDYIENILLTMPGEFRVLCLEDTEARVNNAHCKAVHCTNAAEYMVNGNSVCGNDLPAFIADGRTNEVVSLRG